MFHGLFCYVTAAIHLSDICFMVTIVKVYHSCFLFMTIDDTGHFIKGLILFSLT